MKTIQMMFRKRKKDQLNVIRAKYAARLNTVLYSSISVEAVGDILIASLTICFSESAFNLFVLILEVNPQKKEECFTLLFLLLFNDLRL